MSNKKGSDWHTYAETESTERKKKNLEPVLGTGERKAQREKRGTGARITDMQDRWKED